MIPTEVFHYTKRAIALTILKNKKIRLGQLEFTNDPRETKQWSFPIWHPPLENNRISPKFIVETQYEIQNEANRIMRQEWKVLCTTQHNPLLDLKAPDKRADSHFLYGHSRPRMWAYYGENHAGVCLAFDGEKLDHNIQLELGKHCLIYQGPVRYNDFKSGASYLIDYLEIEKKGMQEAIRKFFFQYHEKIFLIKSKDWETEFEYRWLAYCPENHPEYVSIDGAINALYVGENFPRDDEHALIDLCKESRIPAGRIVWKNGRPLASHGSLYNPQ